MAELRMLEYKTPNKQEESVLASSLEKIKFEIQEILKKMKISHPVATSAVKNPTT